MTADPTTTTTPTVPLAAGAWRAAVFAAALPRNVKIVAAQLAHWAVTPEARELLMPTMLVLGEAAELPHRDVLAAVGTLRRAGWITKGEDAEGRAVTRLCDPREVPGDPHPRP